MGNISVARPDIKIWNVKATSAVRQGSSTSTEQGKLDVTHKDGTTASHDAKFKVESGTLFQDGEICHNYGPKCYCATTTFRFESGASKWKFGDSEQQPADGLPRRHKAHRRCRDQEEHDEGRVELKKQQILKKSAPRSPRGSSPRGR